MGAQLKRDWALALWVLFGCAAGAGLTAYFMPRPAPEACVQAIDTSTELMVQYTGAIIDLTKYDDTTSAFFKMQLTPDLHEQFMQEARLCKEAK